MRTIGALVFDATLFSAFSIAWGWIVWRRIIANPVLRNAVSVTTGWVTGSALGAAALMATSVNRGWLTWHAAAFLFTSYVPVLCVAILLGIYQHWKARASKPEPYGEIFR